VTTGFQEPCRCFPTQQACQLRHPFIVPCIDAWVVAGHTVNMVYAYAERGDLASHLRRVHKAVR